MSRFAPYAVLFVLWSTSIVAAQHILPFGKENVDAPSLGQFPGASSHLRQQILIDELHLRELVNRNLTGLWFRRDFDYGGALEGAVAYLSVHLSANALNANAPSSHFQTNLGPDARRVFEGTFDIPASARQDSTLPNWDVENTLRIEFNAPFTYPGGTLVVDITGLPEAGSESQFWPVDSDYIPADSQFQDYGTHCGNYAFTSSVSGVGLEIGATAFFGAWGAPNGTALFALGTKRVTPLDLSPMGATGCLLYIDPLVGVPMLFSDEEMGSGVGGASIDIAIPSELRLLGVTLDAQWATLEIFLPQDEWSNPAGLTTSNATEFTISSSAPSLGMSTVTSGIAAPGEYPAPTGYVEINKGPVLRFIYQ